MLEDGELLIVLGTSRRSVRVSWAGKDCYFKAGSYVQEGPHAKYWVDYRTLAYAGSHVGLAHS